MSKASIVILPGAWHGPVYMSTVASKLEGLGHAVHPVSMPAIGASTPPKDLSEDISALRNAVTTAIGAGNDVVVVCHSWSGVIASSGLTGLGKKERAANGQKGGVTRVGYMAAFLLDEGVSLIDLLTEGLSWFNVQPPYVYAACDPSVFYNGLPEPEQKQWFEKLQSHAYDTFLARTTAASWKTLPTSYLLCEDDLAIPAPAQESMVEAARGQGAAIDVTRLKSGHSPFLTEVDKCVEWIVGVCEAD